jgi:iron complex transport system ATP-binding protein
MDGILNPQEGSVLVNGCALPEINRSRLAREVAVVAQENYFRFAFTALEVVLMGRFPHLKRFQFEGQCDLEVAREAMRATRTWELAERSIYEVSGGEKQRILLARALAQEPKVILLDEPTSFLDLKYKREIFQLITTLSADAAVSVVVVSHDIDLAAQYCTRIVMLKNGSIFREGGPTEVINAADMEAVYECPVLVDKNPKTGRPRVSLSG